MPTNVGVEIVDAEKPSQKRTKPRLAIRGIRRRTVRKTLHYLELMIAQDQRETERSVVQGYTPLLALKSLSGANKNAADRLIALMLENLKARI